MSHENAIVKIERAGKEVNLKVIQDAYISTGGVYLASAVNADDEDDSGYQLSWDITCDDDQGDESNACDWDDFTVTHYSGDECKVISGGEIE